MGIGDREMNGESAHDAPSHGERRAVSGPISDAIMGSWGHELCASKQETVYVLTDVTSPPHFLDTSLVIDNMTPAIWSL